MRNHTQYDAVVIHMHTIDLKKISAALTAHTGKPVEIIHIEKAGSGFHSDGFRIATNDGRDFFLKRIKSLEGGFEFPERRVSALQVSNSMAQRAGQYPLPVGVILAHGDNAHVAHEVSEDHTIYHVQEFAPSAKNYLDMLSEKGEKDMVDEADKGEIAKIVRLIASVHAVKHPSGESNIQNAVYNDGIRGVLVHPELTFTLLHDFPDDHPHLPPEKQKEHIGRMWKNISSWKDRSDRLAALHGDFWGANVFFTEDGEPFVIDFSRIPWGDPGIDIGWWMSQYLWRYHATKKEYFKELGEEFLNAYIAETGDTEMRRALTISLGFLGIVNIYPKFHPNGLDHDLGERFLGAVSASLDKGEFVWDKE